MSSASTSARETFLRTIAEHDGEWGWYAFECGFPPGTFSDVPPTTRAMDILRQLEVEGLVTTKAAQPQPCYCLTTNGRAMLAKLREEKA